MPLAVAASAEAAGTIHLPSCCMQRFSRLPDISLTVDISPKASDFFMASRADLVAS